MLKQDLQKLIENNKSKKTGFVTYSLKDFRKSETFIYKLCHRLINSDKNKLFLFLKTFVNSNWQSFQRHLTMLKWKQLSSNFSFYMLEAFLEGLAINFVLMILFTLFTIIAVFMLQFTPSAFSFADLTEGLKFKLPAAAVGFAIAYYYKTSGTYLPVPV